MLNTYECDEEESEIIQNVFNKAMELNNINIDEVQVDITIINEADMLELNASTRGIDKATDVLTFPNIDVVLPFVQSDYQDDVNPMTGEVYLGEILICREIMLQQAIDYGHSAVRECAYLTAHGIAHLLGFDHIEESDKIEMRVEEERILGAVGYTR